MYWNNHGDLGQFPQFQETAPSHHGSFYIDKLTARFSPPGVVFLPSCVIRSFSTRETSGFWPKFSTSFSDWWWLEHGWIMTVPYIENFIIPTDELLIFFRVVEISTSFCMFSLYPTSPPNVPGVELDPCRTPAEQGPSFTFAAVRGPVALSGTHSFVEHVGLILGKAQVRTSYLWIKPT